MMVMIFMRYLAYKKFLESCTLLYACVCVCMLYTRLVTKVIKRKSLRFVEGNTCFSSCRSVHHSFSSPSSIYSCIWQRWKTHTVCPAGLYLSGRACIVCICMKCHNEVMCHWYCIILFIFTLWQSPSPIFNWSTIQSGLPYSSALGVTYN